MEDLRLKPTEINTLSERQRSILENALIVARDRFQEDAKQFRDMKPKLLYAEKTDVKLGDKAPLRFIHSSACDNIAEQFEQQAADTQRVLDIIRGDDDNDDPEVIVRYHR